MKVVLVYNDDEWTKIVNRARQNGKTIERYVLYHLTDPFKKPSGVMIESEILSKGGFVEDPDLVQLTSVATPGWGAFEISSGEPELYVSDKPVKPKAKKKKKSRR